MGKLTSEDRCKIEALYSAGVTATKIAQQLGRNKSTITRELSRNSVDGMYQYEEANKLAKKRRSCGGTPKITGDNWTFVRMLLYLKWSPEQISGWLKDNPGVGFYVSDQWIYEYIHKNQAKGGDLYEHLRRAGRPYRNGKFRPYQGASLRANCVGGKRKHRAHGLYNAVNSYLSLYTEKATILE